jgi:hypothetical protein
MWGFDVHPILLNPLKYASPQILYYDREFLICQKYTTMDRIYEDISGLFPPNPA